MDPISIMTMASAALAGGQGAMSIFGQLTGNRAAKRAARAKVASLQASLPLVGQETAFQQSKIIDQVDAVNGAQVASFAGGNIDPSSGSPAILQAMSAAQGETDIAITGARGAQKRADIFQQIADTWQGQSDRNNQLAFGIGTTLLNTAQQWAGLTAFGIQKGMFGGGASTMPAASGNSWNTLAAARQINGFNGFGV